MQLNNLYARFKKDQRGSISAAWTVSMVAILFAIGSAYDTSQASNAKQLAQIAADNMALTASISVDRENQSRYVEGNDYAYAEIGGAAADFTGSLTGSVKYDIQDGDDKLIARATVEGTYTTAFMGIFGRNEIPVKAVSDVAYAEEKGTPASIFFVADNSGSMGDYDGVGVKKINSLETSLTSFMSTLSTIDDDGTDDTFRTALYPYSADPYGYYSSIADDGLIPAHVVSPEWGTIANNKITQMYDRYGTDSSGALQDAADAFDLENGEHSAVNGQPTPLKFLVFMTDGANNTSNECRALRDDEEYWIDTYKNWNTLYTSPQYWFDSWVVYHAPGSEGYEDQEICGWDYHFDYRSLEACTQMKQAGVSIYAIAYDVDASQKAHAEDFMESCSSGDGYFKTADDSSALQAAFSEIGDSILTEVIRIKR